MNRAARRAVAAKQRRKAATPQDPPAVLDRASMVRLFAGMAADDASLTGATLIMPDGSITYLDAGVMRRGGRA